MLMSNFKCSISFSKISKPEKGLHALAIFVSGLFFPAWVLMHLKEYRGEIEPSH